MKTAVLSTVVIGATAALALVTPTAASARPEPTGRDFGTHAAACAETSGMDGSHNPGMHQGFSNWDGLPC